MTIEKKPEILLQNTEIVVMPSMKDIHHEIMIPFGIIGADLITRELKCGKNIVIGCFLNGAILPVAQTIAQLKRDSFDGRIDETTYTQAINSITLYERIRKENSKTKLKETLATLEHPDVTRRVDMAINFDDIGETLDTTTDLHETFPEAELILAAAVKKHKTNGALLEKGYRAQFVREVDDEWILSGCGMDGSNNFREPVSIYQQAQLSVLQRCSNTGTYKKGPGDLSYQSQFAYFSRHNNLLPWVTQLRSYNTHRLSPCDQGFLNDLIDLEIAKMQSDHTTQMHLGYHILQNISLLEYEDIMKITSPHIT